MLDAAEEFIETFPTHARRPEVEKQVYLVKHLEEVDTQKMGVFLPLSGKNGSLGQAILFGMLLALENLQKGEGDITLEIVDIGNPSSTLKEKFEELVFKRHVIAVIGPFGIDEPREIALYAEQLGIPLIAFTSEEDIPAVGPFVFRNFIRKSQQVAQLLDYFFTEKKARRFAIFYPEDESGREFLNLFWDQVVKRGGEIVGVEGFDREATDFSKEIKSLVGLSEGTSKPVIDFDALFIPERYQKVSLILPALAYFDITGIPILGPSNWNTRHFIERAGSQFVDNTYFVEMFETDAKNLAQKKFIEAYESRVDAKASYFSFLGYETAQVVLYILSKRKPDSRDEFRDELAHLKKFTSIMGDVSLSEEGDFVKNHPILKITKNKIGRVN
jgi:ABC-type branched-subunit amino acid transport system substrate-binding protein